MMESDFKNREFSLGSYKYSLIALPRSLSPSKSYLAELTNEQYEGLLCWRIAAMAACDKKVGFTRVSEPLNIEAGKLSQQSPAVIRFVDAAAFAMEMDAVALFDARKEAKLMKQQQEFLVDVSFRDDRGRHLVVDNMSDKARYYLVDDADDVWALPKRGKKIVPVTASAEAARLSAIPEFVWGVGAVKILVPTRPKDMSAEAIAAFLTGRYRDAPLVLGQRRGKTLAARDLVRPTLAQTLQANYGAQPA